MASKPVSAGLLLFRSSANGELEILLGHMGGPFWVNKHEHAWSIPKGLAEDVEDDLLDVAEREFAEEMGSPAPPGETLDLGSVNASGKTIHVFARRGDFDVNTVASNMFSMEWPPRSGQFSEFPEIDRAEWVQIADATTFLTKGQAPFVERVAAAVTSVD